MQDFVKQIWIILVISTTFSVIGYIMTSQYQPLYLKELSKIQSIPQQRIDATYKYIESIENGELVPNDNYYSETTIQQNNPKSASSKHNQKYKKPLYIRDKNNPRILHKCK